MVLPVGAPRQELDPLREAGGPGAPEVADVHGLRRRAARVIRVGQISWGIMVAFQIRPDEEST